jgi:hypothetical protein
MDDKSDDELLHDLWAAREWLRHNPTGMQAEMTKRRIRELERELKRRGVDVEAAGETCGRGRLGRSVWFVAVNSKDRPGDCIHADPHCMHLSDTRHDRVREATESEIDRLAPCTTCSG